jgi:4-alpha-glucanotransferase
MAAVNRELNVYGDIPVGVASPGLDTLIWPEEIAVEFRLGAPPDSVHLKPQIWDVHGWMPSALARSGYQPYRDTIWSNLAATSGVRIDHALALARQFFVGADDQSGVYVESDMHPLVEALLDVVSAQGAYVYLETLGTPVPQLEEMLDAYGVPRYRLLLADPAASSQARPEDLVALTNHDTPTLRGLWSGADLRAQHALGFHGDDEAQRELLAELRRQTGSPTTFEEFQLRLYELLAQCPARRVALHVEDALGQSFRFHLPGHPNGPNYQRPGEVPVELWGNSPTLRHLSEVMSAHGASV